MSSSLSQEGLTNRCSSGNHPARASSVGCRAVWRVVHRRTTMSEGRAHPEEVGREHATECVWIVSRCLSVISSCVLPRAGRVYRSQLGVRVRDYERRAAQSSDTAPSRRTVRPRDGVRWRRGVPAGPHRHIPVRSQTRDRYEGMRTSQTNAHS